MTNETTVSGAVALNSELEQLDREREERTAPMSEQKPVGGTVGLDAIVGRCIAVAQDGRWLPGTIEHQMVQALAGQRNEIERLREALGELRDKIKHHPAYADLTENEEIEIGGDTAEMSYMARVIDEALKPNASLRQMINREQP